MAETKPQPTPRPDGREAQQVTQADMARMPHQVLAPAGAVAERPQPSEFRDRLPEKSDEHIVVGDAEAARARLGAERPMRSLDPARQPPAPRPGKELRKGETYWIVNAEDLDQPHRGKVIRLTRTPGKHVGVEFEQPIGPHIVHDCDGAGKMGHCLYCRPDQVLSDEEYRAYYERRKADLAARQPLEDLETLRLDVAHDGRQSIG